MNFFEKLEKLIGIDVKQYFSDVVSFYQTYDKDIVQYYTNVNASYPQEAFDVMEELKDRGNKILEKITFYKGYLTNIEYWDILDKIDSIYLKFDVINKYAKFYKVTQLRKQNPSGVEEKYILKQNQTLEDLADERANQSWSDIALNNYLIEEDYTSKGGVKLILKANDSVVNAYALESIIDIAIGENLLGKDIPEYYEFDDQTNDLVVLNTNDTFVHTIQRLLGLRQGALPENPTIGIQKDIVGEATRGEGIFFPILIRQLSQSLKTDDTIASFAVTDIRREEDNLYVRVECYNRLGQKVEIENILE